MATPSNAPYKLIQRQPPFSVRQIEPGASYRTNGRSLVRVIPKLRGKANVKRAKRERIAARLRAAAA